MSSYNLYWNPGDLKATTLGVDPSKHHVIAYDETTKTLVLKTPGHSYWAGMMMDRGYAGARMWVARLKKKLAHGNWEYETLVEWDVRKKVQEG